MRMSLSNSVWHSAHSSPESEFNNFKIKNMKSGFLLSYIEMCIPQRWLYVELTVSLTSRISCSVTTSSTDWAAWCSSNLNSGGATFKRSLGTPAILTEVYCGFPQFLQATPRILPQLSTLLPSKSFAIHHSPINLSFNTIIGWATDIIV
jgi:hypothetical protein